MAQTVPSVPAMQTFVFNVRQAMEKKNVSVSELAVDSQMATQTLSALLNNRGGNCSLTTAETLAECLGIPLHKLLTPKE